MKKTFTKIALCLTALAFAGNLSAQTNFLTEDFEAGMPATWTQVTSATDGGWVVGLNTALQSQGFPINAHTKMACSNDDKCNCNKISDLLYTPSIDLSTATFAFLSYDCYYFNGTYQSVTESATISVSTDGGATWTDVATVPANATPWQTNNVDLSAYAGNSNVMVGFKYSDGGGWLYGWAIDNVSIYEPAAGVDISVASTVVGKNDPTPTFVPYTKYLTGLPLSVSVTVSNLGTVPITDFDFSWTDGTNTFNQSFSGLNITALGTYTFVANDPYVTLSGAQTITSTISNVNSGATELNANNNSSSQGVQGVIAHPDKRYFAEEGTGTWCGWCPRGAVFMAYMKATYPDQFVGIAVHNGDPMTVAAYDAGIGTFISGYPSVVSNRNAVIDPSQLEGDFLDVITTAPPVVITGNAMLNTATNDLAVYVNGAFSQNFSGDIRFAAMVVEDSVHVVSSGYNQTNYYAGGGNGPMGGFESLAATVPSASMYYDFVGRQLMAGFTGAAGSLPSNITAGSNYNYTFTSVVPATWNQNRLSVAVVVIQISTGEVLNALELPVVFTTTGINENQNVASLSLYPNPANDQLNLSYELTSNDKVSITINDAIGKTILNQSFGQDAAGKHNVTLDLTSFPAGIYQLSMQTESGIMTRKFVKE